MYDLLADYGAPLAHAFLQDLVSCDECGIELDVEAKALGAVKFGLSLHSPLAYWAFAVSGQPSGDAGDVVEMFAGQFEVDKWIEAE